MSDTDIYPAPEVDFFNPSDDKLDTERRAFQEMRESLMTDYLGKYVAIHNGQIVGVGDDKLQVASRAYDDVGYVPIYVGHVTTEQSIPVVRMPSPRLLRNRPKQ